MMMLNNICRFFLLDLYFLKLNAASTSSYLTAAFQKLSVLPEPFIDCRKNQAQPDPAPLEMCPVQREMKEDRMGVLLTVLDLMLEFKMQPMLTFFLLLQVQSDYIGCWREISLGAVFKPSSNIRHVLSEQVVYLYMGCSKPRGYDSTAKGLLWHFSLPASFCSNLSQIPVLFRTVLLKDSKKSQKRSRSGQGVRIRVLRGDAFPL